MQLLDTALALDLSGHPKPARPLQQGESSRELVAHVYGVEPHRTWAPSTVTWDLRPNEAHLGCSILGSFLT